MVTYNIRYVDHPATSYLEDDSTSTITYPRLPIVVGPPSNDHRHSYSPVLAIFNTLLMMKKIELPSFGIETISSGDIANLLCDYALSYGLAKAGENGELDMTVIEAIHNFVGNVDHDIEWQCTYGLKGFESNPEISRVYAGIGLDLLNGAVIDPNRQDTFASFAHNGFERDGMAQQLKEAKANDPSSSKAVCLGMALKGYRPLTAYGYRLLQEDTKEGKLYLVTFGGRCYTLLKKKRKNYVLVTDSDIGQTDAGRNVVWQRLDRIYGGDEPFADSNFNPIKRTVLANNKAVDFTADLDWHYDRKEYYENIEEYEILGYDPSQNNRNNSRSMANNVDSDEAIAWRLQKQYAEESRFEGPGIQANDLEAAIQASMRDAGISNQSSPSPPSSSVTGAIRTSVGFKGPTRRWNLDLIIGLEVRSKYYMELHKTDDSGFDENFEIWDRGCNAIREKKEQSVTCPDDLPMFDGKMVRSVFETCVKIMSLQEKVIPDSMNDTAQSMAMDELLHRDGEHEHLIKVLFQDGEGFVRNSDPPTTRSTSSDGSKDSDNNNNTNANAETTANTATGRHRKNPAGDQYNMYKMQVIQALTRRQDELTFEAIKEECKHSLLEDESETFNDSVFHDVVQNMISAQMLSRAPSGTGETLFKYNHGGGSDSGSDNDEENYHDSDSDDESDVPGLVDRNLNNADSEDEEGDSDKEEKPDNDDSDSDDDLPDLADKGGSFAQEKFMTRFTHQLNHSKNEKDRKKEFTEESGAEALQSVWRGRTTRECTEVRQRLVVRSTITIQALWRKYATQIEMKRIVAAKTVQAPLRGFLEKMRYKKKRAAATRLAAMVRGLSAKIHVLRIMSTNRINAAARGFLERRQVLRIRLMTRINSVVRCFLAKRRYGDEIKAGFAEWKRVNEQWIPVAACVSAKALEPKSSLFSWNNLKKTSFDISQAEEDKETAARIDAARKSLTSDDESDKENEDDESCDGASSDKIIATPKPAEISSDPSQECDHFLSKKYDNIMLSQATLKWFKDADSKYRGFFLRRMHQFANGEYERSYKLRKRLTGCKHIIYEAYLEQKVAYRIIFTECRSKEGEDCTNGKNETNSILVWYVSTHDRVSRYIKQIDECEARMNRQFRASASELLDNDYKEGNSMAIDEGNAMVIDDDTILLDPCANTPLKIHQLPSSDIKKLLEGWMPPFRLTNDEKTIVSTPGTVLVLGRSGTGKTVCIVNRMVFDADLHRSGDHSAPLKQLFISRSRRIKDLVQTLVEEVTVDSEHLERSFVSFERIIRDCNSALTKIGYPTEISAMEESKLQQNFAEFKEFFISIKKEIKTKLTALVVWTQIRTFIKGSIEAVINGRPLTEAEYLGLGKSYCRLNQEQRREAYGLYKKYASWLESNCYYDSCDRTVDLLNRIHKVSLEDRSENNIRFDKIYVDECQDFTSSDFALFWSLCQGGGDLFLAGDTAQSVEQGIAFRFDDVKRVFYEMGKGDRSGVPSSPLTIQINFRSHSGVLEVAATILKMLHEAFPGSANKLQGDKGLFKGPRPSILNLREEKPGRDVLRDIVTKNPSLVVLTPDENTAALKDQLGESIADDVVVLGICEAKGLDFDEVIIVDFFSTASKRLGQAWKDIFRKATGSKNYDPDLQDKYPELEMRLKLLYTAITRCRHRLFFVETMQSAVGDGFSRWVLGTGLAEKQDVADLSVQLKSADEWRSLGVEYAINAESQDTAQEAEAWFKRASMCFRQANDDRLLNKTEAQAKVHGKAMALFADELWGGLKQEVPALVMECLEGGGYIDLAIDICETLRERCPDNDKKLKNAAEKVLKDMKSVRDLM